MAKWCVHTVADDCGSGHIDYVGLMSEGWMKFYDCDVNVCVVVPEGTHIEADSSEVPRIDSEKLGLAQCAKLARLWSACLVDTDLPIMLDDIDWVPLSGGFFAEKFAAWKPGHVLRMGLEVYKGNAHEEGKAPMGTLTATRDVFEEIINPDGLGWSDWVRSLYGKNSYDVQGREDPLHPGFSDESLFRRMLYQWSGYPHQVIDVCRGWDTWRDTIDRSRWDLIDINKMREGGYVGAHLLKHYKENFERCVIGKCDGWPADLVGMRPIVEHILGQYECES